MSTTTLYVVPKAGPVERFREYHNSWGFAMRIWQSMSQHYLGHDFPLGNMAQCREVWALAGDTAVPLSHAAVLASTFDRAMVEYERLPDLAQAYRRFVVDFPYGTDHLPAIANALDEITASGRTDVAGICFYPMSVAKNLWWVADDSDDEGHYYDLSRDTGHWWVFAHLQEERSEENGNGG